MQDIVIENLSKAYDGRPVLQALSLTFPAGQTTAVMAPSGWGKTTLLRILMGLEAPDSGTVRGLAGLRISAVFQEDRLCVQLDAADNVRLVTPGLTRAQAQQALDAVGLQSCAGQPVRELSGGQRRRTAIARALLARWDVLFLDEPFRGLDADTRRLVLDDTRRRCVGRTVILVTHDETEAAAMAACSVLRLGTGVDTQNH